MLPGMCSLPATQAVLKKQLLHHPLCFLSPEGREGSIYDPASVALSHTSTAAGVGVVLAVLETHI